jgi:hypothetical protein
LRNVRRIGYDLARGPGTSVDPLIQQTPETRTCLYEDTPAAGRIAPAVTGKTINHRSDYLHLRRKWMFTKLEVERTTSTNYLLNTTEVDYNEFMERMEEIVADQQREIEHFSQLREKAQEGGHTLAAAHYAKSHMEIYEKTMNNIDTLELAGQMKDSVIFLMTGAVPSFIYVGKKRKQEHENAKENLKMIYR